MKMEIWGLSVSTRAVSRSVSCFTEIIPDFLTFLCNNRLGDGFLDLRKLCLPLSDDFDSRNFSFREIRRSHQPVSSNFLIEINGCVLLQSNSENFFTENAILNAFSLALSHVEIVIQCLLSKFFRKFSMTVVFEAFDDVVHCELHNIMCSELCFHNDFRCPCKPLRHSFGPSLSQSSALNSTISFPLSKFFVDAARELWHLLILSAVNST